MDRQRTLMLVGAIIVLYGFVQYAMATVIIDQAAPTVVSSTPENGLTYGSLDTVAITLNDPGTGVASGYTEYSDDIPYSVMLSLTSGDEYSGTHTGAGPGTPSPGWYSFQFYARDGVGNELYHTGTYQIYTQLQGDWYINSVLVTPSSIVGSSSPTVDFKFVKSVGIDDGSITCTMTITSGGSGGITLTNTALGEWTGSHTFPGDGTYVVELKADDGVGTPVVASILDVGLGGIAEKQDQGFVWIGVMVIGIGFVFMGTKKRG